MMQRFEFKVIPAPRRGEKARGVKTTEDRFALALTTLMNQMGADGWDYVRADALPVDERTGLTGTKTTFQNMLVFRRPVGAAGSESQATVAADAPRLITVDAPTSPAAPRVGAAEAPLGAAPSVGPANPGMAAE